MPFDPTQPFATYANDVGNIYRLQSGTYYDPNGNAVSPLPSTWPPSIASQPVWQSFTAAQLPAAAGFSGYTVFVSDWGANGTLARSNGTRWLPVNGQTMLKRMGLAPGPIAGTETIVLSGSAPATIVQTGDMIHLRFSGNKSGVTDNAMANFRVGTTGTVSDTAITGFNSIQVMPAAATTTGIWASFRVLSNTSMQRMGLNSANQSSYGAAANATAIAAATTGLSDFSSNTMSFTFTIKSSSTNDTIGVQECSIIHEAG